METQGITMPSESMLKKAQLPTDSMKNDFMSSDGYVKESHWNDKEALDLEELIERITLILQNEKNIPLYKRQNIKQLMR